MIMKGAAMPRGWKLWYGPTTPESVQGATACDFYRIGAQWTLCYAKGKNIGGMQAATDDLLQKLSVDDQRWLKECIDAVLKRKAHRERWKIEDNNRAFLQRFANELQREKRKLSGMEVNSDGKRAENYEQQRDIKLF